jgi:hypothetical protein
MTPDESNLLFEKTTLAFTENHVWFHPKPCVVLSKRTLAFLSESAKVQLHLLSNLQWLAISAIEAVRKVFA